jgi:multiple sugar transport system ATP-binding protein
VAEIVLDHITKRYPDGTEAVKDVNLRIADGELIVLVGPSGCGKSTTLNMIAGLDDISEGKLTFDGEVVNDRSPRDRDVAMVFQSYALYPHMTVRQNMGFALELAKAPKDEIDRKVDHAAQTLDLTPYLDRKPANLSGGQRQRVAMGRAIVRDPKVFLMDEPLSNLDAKLRVQMRTEVARIQKNLGTTMVYVTHDQTEAMTLGDAIAIMRNGVIQQVGSPEELYEQPVNIFVAGFIGSPSMNFLPATMDGDVLRTPIGDITLPADRRAKVTAGATSPELVLGIRPEHFEDAELVGDQRPYGATITRPVDVLESLGADKYVYFTVEGATADSAELQELAADVGAAFGGKEQIAARLDVASRAREGQPLELWFDLRRIQVFDLHTGRTVTL